MGMVKTGSPPLKHEQRSGAAPLQSDGGVNRLAVSIYEMNYR